MTILWIFRRATVVKRSYEFQRASHRVSSRRLERRLGAGGRLCRAPHDPRCGWGECPGLESRGTRLLQAGFGDAGRLVPRPEQRRKTRDCPLVRCGFRERMAGRALRADPGHSAAGTDALLDAVRSGRPIRLAWGGAFQTPSGEITVEHAAGPVFTSIRSVQREGDPSPASKGGDRLVHYWDLRICLRARSTQARDAGRSQARQLSTRRSVSPPEFRGFAS
jgi:hypothetical protein